MPTYLVTDPTTKKKLKLTGDSPPTEQELEQIFSSQSKPSQSIQESPVSESGVRNFLSGVGKSFSDIGQGAKQIGLGMVESLTPEGLVDFEKAKTGISEDISATRERDAPLMGTKSGMAGNIAGNVAAFAPTAFIPGANTAVGAGLTGASMGALQPVSQDESRLRNAGIGAAGALTGQAIGRYASNKLADLAANKAAKVTADATAKTASKAGFTIPPTQTNPTIWNRILEAWSGKLSTAQQAAIKNQPLVNKKALAAIGLPEDTALTKETLEVVREAAGESYDQLSKVGKIATDKTFLDRVKDITKTYQIIVKDSPKEAVKEIDDFIDDVAGRIEFDMGAWVERLKQLRFESKVLYKSDNPAKVALGKIKNKVANAFEDLVERRLMEAGNPTLLKEFQTARTIIAKTFTIEKALNPATGNINASKLGNILKSGKPITGELKDIAMAQQAYPKALQEITSSMPGGSPLDVATAAIGTAAAQNPSQIASVLSLVLGRPVARATILSKPFQKLFGTPNYSPATLKALATPQAKSVMRIGIPASISAGEQ